MQIWNEVREQEKGRINQELRNIEKFNDKDEQERTKVGSKKQ